MQTEFVVYSLGPWLMDMMIIDSLPSEEYGSQLSSTQPLPPRQLAILQPSISTEPPRWSVTALRAPAMLSCPLHRAWYEVGTICLLNKNKVLSNFP